MIVVRSWLRKSMVVAAVAVGLVGLTGGTAMANQYNTYGTATSTITFTPGTTTYNQQHNGDDLAFTVATGISVDMQWVNCAGTQSGSINYNIAAGSGYRTLGTNFAAGACLHINYRGWDHTGGFSGTTFWNYSWV